MAERKKTTKTEEVKVEKRFCTNCGKELKENEVCDCQATSLNNATVVNGDAIMNTVKKTWNTILDVFKNPDTTITKETNAKDNNMGITMFIVLAVSYAIYLMAGAKSIINIFSNGITSGLGTSVSVSNYINIPYFKIFIYGLLIYAVMALIPMFAAFVVSKISKNANYTFNKSFKLYIACNAPLVIVYLAMALIFLINIPFLTLIGWIGTAIISLFCFFNFILGYIKEVSIREDRKSYALTGLIGIWVIIEIIVFALFLGSLVSDITKIESKPSSSYNDLFNW